MGSRLVACDTQTRRTMSVATVEEDKVHSTRLM